MRDYQPPKPSRRRSATASLSLASASCPASRFRSTAAVLGQRSANSVTCVSAGARPASCSRSSRRSFLSPKRAYDWPSRPAMSCSPCCSWPAAQTMSAGSGASSGPFPVKQSVARCREHDHETLPGRIRSSGPVYCATTVAFVLGWIGQRSLTVARPVDVQSAEVFLDSRSLVMATRSRRRRVLHLGRSAGIITELGMTNPVI